MQAVKVFFCVSIFAVLAGSLGPLVRAAPLGAGPAEHFVLAFYYTWFDQNTWQPSIVPDMPTQPYISSDRNTIVRHVAQARQAGLDAFVVSWLGTGNQTDWNLGTMLSVAQGTDFKVTIDFETTSPFFQNQGDLINALRYVTSTYFNNPNWLHYHGKPVLFFWRLPAVYTAPGQSQLAAWQYIRDQVDPNRTALWIGEGDDFTYLQVFDGIHAYSIAWAPDPAGTLSLYAQQTRNQATALGVPKLWVATAMPGYNDLRTSRPDAFAVDRQDGNYYIRTFQGAIATNPEWIIITSFNEWVEGSQIEPSVTYGDQYLNLTSQLAGQFRAPFATTSGTMRGPDYDVPGGHFFSQTASAGQGYIVDDQAGVPFWTTFQNLGGVSTVGYPVSRRFSWNGVVTQAFQKMVFQWQPATGRVFFVNVFDELHNAGKDAWLAQVRSTPGQLDPSFDAGKDWSAIVASRLALLDANAAIQAKYWEIGSVVSPLDSYGLPTSTVIDNGSHYAMRFQRAVIQQWKVTVPWASAGQATVANGGDVLKEAGMLDPSVAEPEPAP
jgi:hypothetical protein